MWKFFYTVILLLYFSKCEAQSYDDKRCKCICPSIASVLNTTFGDKKVLNFITNVPATKCNCEGVVLPKIGDQIKEKDQIFCPRCDCKYENRNTTIIKIVVIIVIWVISLLVIYMLFLICLEPLLNKRLHKATGGVGYQEHNNEELLRGSSTFDMEQVFSDEFLVQDENFQGQDTVSFEAKTESHFQLHVDPEDIASSENAHGVLLDKNIKNINTRRQKPLNDFKS